MTALPQGQNWINMFDDATQEEINNTMQKAWETFSVYKNKSLAERAVFMKTIAAEIENCGDELIQTAMAETNLPEARLRNERARTMFQLTSYADACVKGHWLEARIDRALPEKNPPKPDIRKMNVPLGPVVVFGSSNFPFAYSTAGGDTASALAAGCPVIVKAHPAHPKTSALVAKAVLTAVAKCNMPDGVFSHLFGASFTVGEQLVVHTLTKAVGFTGSFSGGKALFDAANKRTEPIPVFAEMGSTNPVFLLPGKLKTGTETIAKNLAASFTLGCGQFCTKPGLIIGIASDELNNFTRHLSSETEKLVPSKMLHQGIYKAYNEKSRAALSQSGVTLAATASAAAGEMEGVPTVAVIDGKTFLQNPLLHQEVFGPFTMIVTCSSNEELHNAASALDGQLTATLLATETDIEEYAELTEIIKTKCGRLILNGVPTGVEVCHSMQHGGPWPASSDSRFTSVGADAIKRFVRPLAYQNWPNKFLPEELKDENTLGIARIES